MLGTLAKDKNAIKIALLIKNQTEKHDECKANDWVCWILVETTQLSRHEKIG